MGFHRSFHLHPNTQLTLLLKTFCNLHAKVTHTPQQWVGGKLKCIVRIAWSEEIPPRILRPLSIHRCILHPTRLFIKTFFSFFPPPPIEALRLLQKKRSWTVDQQLELARTSSDTCKTLQDRSVHISAYKKLSPVPPLIPRGLWGHDFTTVIPLELCSQHMVLRDQI